MVGVGGGGVCVCVEGEGGGGSRVCIHCGIEQNGDGDGATGFLHLPAWWLVNASRQLVTRVAWVQVASKGSRGGALSTGTGSGQGRGRGGQQALRCWWGIERQPNAACLVRQTVVSTPHQQRAGRRQHRRFCLSPRPPPLFTPSPLPLLHLSSHNSYHPSTHPQRACPPRWCRGPPQPRGCSQAATASPCGVIR